MKQSLQLRLGQHLTMTPQLQQAIRLLQLSTMELQTEIQEALESNLMLEVEEEDGSRLEAGESAVTPVDIPAELPVDSGWEDIYDGAGYGSGGEAEGSGLDVHGSSGESLHEHLAWQLNLLHLSDTDRLIGATVIDAIDEDGYLSASLEELRETLAGNGLEVGVEEVEAVLHQIQNLDPAGVGARNLGESLFLQLRQRSVGTPWREQAMELARRHLDLLAARDFEALAGALGIGREDLQQVLTLIQSLSPRPGAQIHPTPSPYIIPDVLVFKDNGVWKVELNPEAAPRLRVNAQYASLVRRADSSADNNFLRAHLQEARWFIKSLKSRSETLLKVATCIVERQRGFLEHGEEAMRPMVLHDVADAINMHESTVSRVTTNKYMHTPRGIYELKYFFSSHVSTRSGGECSSTAIRALLRKLIAAENPHHPLSDSKLASILSDQGINVARRTVAKYREAMAIPPSNERKSLL